MVKISNDFIRKMNLNQRERDIEDFTEMIDAIVTKLKLNYNKSWIKRIIEIIYPK